jgi:hypothetical protein
MSLFVSSLLINGDMSIQVGQMSVFNIGVQSQSTFIISRVIGN